MPRLGAPAGNNNGWSKRLSHSLVEARIPTPSLCVCPFLAGLAGLAALNAVAEIVSAHLQTPSGAGCSAEMGYSASPSARYIARERGFTAFWSLMHTRRPANPFIGNGATQFTAVWDGPLTEKAPQLRQRFRELGIIHADCLLPWPAARASQTRSRAPSP